MRFWEKDATLGGCRLRQNNSISFLKLEVKPFICIIYIMCFYFTIQNEKRWKSGFWEKNANGGGSWLRQRRRTPLGESEIKPNLIRMNQTNLHLAPLCIHLIKYIFILLTKPVVPVSTNPIPSISNWYHLILTQYHFCTTQLLLLGKFEYTGGPIFKVVLEC